MSSGKLILLLIAMGMVGLVLLLGYKLDKYEEKGKRKEKITKKRDNKKNDDSYAYFKSLKNNYEEENQTAAFGNIYYDFNKETSTNDKYLERFDKTAIIEKINLSKLEEIQADGKYALYDNESIYEEPEFESDFDEKYEEDEAYDFENTNSSTMVFDSTAVKEELVTNIKGYEFEDENIKNIKNEIEKPKATRKTTTKKVEEKPKTTRKTTTKKVEEKPKATRKTTTKIVEEKPKATRKTTTKKVDEKQKTTKKSTTKKVEEKPKTTKKSTTKKVEEKPKVTRKATDKKTVDTLKKTKTNTKNKDRNI